MWDGPKAWPPAPIFRVGWDKLAQVIGGPAQAAPCANCTTAHTGRFPGERRPTRASACSPHPVRHEYCELAHPRFQNRAAASELLLLGGVVKGVPQIDEIKIDAVDVRSAQVGPAQVGLADFFRRFEILLVVI